MIAFFSGLFLGAILGAILGAGGIILVAIIKDKEPGYD